MKSLKERIAHRFTTLVGTSTIIAGLALVYLGKCTMTELTGFLLVGGAFIGVHPEDFKSDKNG